MTKIVAFCGKKRSGKTTSANFVHGAVLKQKEVIKDFSINDNGELVVNSVYIDEHDQIHEEMGVLDLSQNNYAYYDFAENRIWPYIKLYNFADALKEICMSVFGLTYEQTYGLDKDSNTQLMWENMPGVIVPEVADTLFFEYDEPVKYADFERMKLLVHEPGCMTAREVLQFVGTDIFRKMHNSVWIDLVMNKIASDKPEIAVIADCRFKNEADAIKRNGGVLIHLTRSTSEDSHKSENSLSGVNFDFTIDNSNLSISQSNERLLSFLRGIIKV